MTSVPLSAPLSASLSVSLCFSLSFQVLTHTHEKADGRTSCLSQHLMGFGSDGKPVVVPFTGHVTPAMKQKVGGSVLKRE